MISSIFLFSNFVRLFFKSDLDYLQEEAAQRELGVNLNSDLTTIQVRMPDGKLQAKLNTSNTVGDLRRYIRYEIKSLLIS